MVEIKVKVGEKTHPAPKATVIFRKRIRCKTCEGQHCIGRCKY